MKKILIAISATTFLFANVNATGNETTTVINESRVVYHGGGSRKSSPAGQCCHKNHRTGYVHCH